MLGVANDFNNVLVGQSYNPKYKEICEKNYIDRIIPFLNKMDTHYKKQATQFMTGDSLTIADLKLFENLQHCQHHYSDSLATMEGLIKF